MMFKSMTRRVSMLAAFLTLPTAFAAAQGVTVAPAGLEQEGIELIQELETTARNVQYNSEWLNMHSRSLQTSKASHYDHLWQIKQLVNGRLNPALTRLTEIQKELPVWHQDTIDRLLTSAQSLALDANSAILSQKEAGAIPPVANQEYRAFVSGLNKHAAALVTTADAAGEYAKAHQQAVEAGLNVHRY